MEVLFRKVVFPMFDHPFEVQYIPFVVIAFVYRLFIQDVSQITTWLLCECTLGTCALNGTMRCSL